MTRLKETHNVSRGPSFGPFKTRMSCEFKLVELFVELVPVVKLTRQTNKQPNLTVPISSPTRVDLEI